jgi:glycerol-3-phosphate acyltransferase PlsY
VHLGTSGGIAAAAVVAGYALGTLPTALLVARRHGVDPTTAGSGNPGATNVMRTVGRTAGALTLVGDVGKGIAAAGLGWLLGGRALAVLCGVAAVAGHVAPVTRRLRGGKGVATGFGMTVTIFPLAALAGAVWFYVVRGLQGRPSILSQAGIVLLPVVAAVHGVSAGELAALTAGAALVLYRLWAAGPDQPPAAQPLAADPDRPLAGGEGT